MKFVIVLFVFLAFVPAAVAQEKKVAAIKVFEMNDDDNESFISGMREFIRKLERSPKDTTGFVAIAQNRYQRQKIVKEMLRQRPTLKKRIEYTNAVCSYNKGWENTEFWLIPKGADEPYTPRTCDPSCPDISILEPLGIDSVNKQITFTASIIGGGQDEPITYQWTVTGGEIVNGQGTPSLVVKLRDLRVTSVTANLAIGGINEDAHCFVTATSTYNVVP